MKVLLLFHFLTSHITLMNWRQSALSATKMAYLQRHPTGTRVLAHDDHPPLLYSWHRPLQTATRPATIRNGTVSSLKTLQNINIGKVKLKTCICNKFKPGKLPQVKLIMAALRSRCGQYIFALLFLSIFFFLFLA